MRFEEYEGMSEVGEKGSWKRAPGWMKALLVVSLVANAAVLGIVGGWKMRHGTSDEPGLSRQQARILALVPEPRRDAARNILLSRQDEVAAARKEMRAALEELVAAIRAEPFSADRLAAALAARRTASGKVWGIGYEQLAEIAAGLNAADRVALADRIEERYNRWMERRKGDR
jgi:uncharacterized membrane protein